MVFRISLTIFLSTLLLACNLSNQSTEAESSYPKVEVVGAMKNVMWKGELAGVIALDTITSKSGLYGLGPESGLTGEILINNGRSYLSKVLSDSSMEVKKSFDSSAPFFVYSNVNEWQEIALPPQVKGIKELEEFIESKATSTKSPFVFKLKGEVVSAAIHIQNLPPGSKVSSPQEAHQGQVNYDLIEEAVEIVGFFSKEHQGIFTHHDRYSHMHLITQDESKMGHLDEVVFKEMSLFLPKK